MENSAFFAGGMRETEERWFQYEYGNCIAYDRNKESCFLCGSNDSYPGDNTFTSDLIIYYKNNFLGGFSYFDPE